MASRNVTVGIALIGPGLIGKSLVEQIRSQAGELLRTFGIEFQLLAVVSSTKMLLTESPGIDINFWEYAFNTQAKRPSLPELAVFLQEQQPKVPHRVVIDCTASEEVAKFYSSLMSSPPGVHIITPNKRMGSGPHSEYLALQRLRRADPKTHFLYEATVGAGLPVISTLKGLVETGDKVKRIEGVLSGTLSHIFNSFGPSLPFSEVVRSAKEQGFTEPDPRDDLSGMDVARKVVILARECGMAVELADVEVASLVPPALQECTSAEDYLARLPEFDEAMARQAADAEARGEVLRYVGAIDVEGQNCSVSLRSFPRAHPLASLSGSDNMIAFTTERYSAQPLIVRGPGAGSAVTAAGVFADLLQLARYVGAAS